MSYVSIETVSISDVTRGRFTDNWIDKLKLYGMRSWTFEPQTTFSSMSPGDEVDSDGRLLVQWQRLVPSSAPLTKFVTAIAATTAGLTACEAYVIDPDTLKVQGRTADLVTPFSTTGRKEITLTADTGGTLSLPKDQKWVGLAIRFAGTDVPTFWGVNPPSGTAWDSTNGMAIGAETGWQNVTGALGVNAAISTVSNVSWNASIWMGFK